MFTRSGRVARARTCRRQLVRQLFVESNVGPRTAVNPGYAIKETKQRVVKLVDHRQLFNIHFRSESVLFGHHAPLLPSTTLSESKYFCLDSCKE